MYKRQDDTTSYIGKGPKSRIESSMRSRIDGTDKATASVHMDFGDDEMGYMAKN